MSAEVKISPIVVLAHSYSEYPKPEHPYALDFGNILVSRAVAILTNQYPDTIQQIVIGTGLHIHTKNPTSPLIADAMRNLVLQYDAKLGPSPLGILIAVERSRTSTVDELNTAKKVSVSEDILSVCLDYHRPRVLRD